MSKPSSKHQLSSNSGAKINDLSEDFIQNGENEKLLGENAVATREGTIKSSIFSIVILCLGSGTLTFPYIFYANGVYLGLGLILFGASISVFAGWLIVQCAEECGARRYEDIALKLYGRNMATFTSFMMLLTMLGFVIAYIVLVSFIITNLTFSYS